MVAKVPKVAYDIEAAESICNELPLENIEGVWLYPEDHVIVMILREDEGPSIQFPSYAITVVETSDARLRPGDRIGTLSATAKENEYKISLNTERKKDFLLKPKSCLGKLSSNSDSFIIHKQKSLFKGTLNFNFNRLLPGFWKLVSGGISTNGSNDNATPAVGMIKLYPSYDGNGSSRRKVRYL